MRPRVLHYLESTLGWESARYWVPTGTTILALALLLALWVMVHRARRTGVPVRPLLMAAPIAVGCGLLGSRLFHIVQHASGVLADPERFLAWGGTTSWGGYLAGTAAFVLYLARSDRGALVYLDLLASAQGLGPMIARWGCFMNGCCFGGPSSLPWAVRYPDVSFAHAAHVDAGWIEPGSLLSAAVHPVQVYGSLLGLGMFLAASAVWRRFRTRPGTTFAFYWTAYAGVRFGVEFLRGDVPRLGPVPLTLSQIVCLVLVAAGVWGLRRALGGGGSPLRVRADALPRW